MSAFVSFVFCVVCTSTLFSFSCLFLLVFSSPPPPPPFLLLLVLLLLLLLLCSYFECLCVVRVGTGGLVCVRR